MRHRSVAIGEQGAAPLVVLHGVGKIDRLALELSDQMRIPLAVSKISSIDTLIRELRGIGPD